MPRCDIFVSDPVEPFAGSNLAGRHRLFHAGLELAQMFADPVRRLDDLNFQLVRYKQGISGRCRGVTVAQPIGAGAENMMIKDCHPGLDPG